MARASSRAAALAGAAVLVTSLAMVGGPSRAAASSAQSRRCPGTVSVTNPGTATLIGADITVHGPVGCERAKRTIRTFFHKELEANLRCAEAANDPPYKGCRVGAFTCRGSASLLNAKGCANGGERVDFRERDVAVG
jgi:hypothetical protein